MSWFKEQPLSWFQRLCLKVLKQGAVPEHVAFIMDGNRRFATKKNMESIDGHTIGFDKLTQTLEWCLQMGIHEVTVYAFSIENFKRSEEEVSALMKLAEEKLGDFLTEKDKIDEHGLCIRVVGDLLLLPQRLQKLIAEAVLMTENNNRMFLNVCLSYTSRHEMCLAVEDIAEGVRNGIIEPDDINESLLSSSMLVTSEPDLLVRTSGEFRLSDFLLWQSSYSVLAFLKVLWPEFDIWHLFLGVLFYQFSCKHVHKTKEVHKMIREEMEYKEDLINALSQVQTEQNERHSIETQGVEDILPTREEKLIESHKNAKNLRKIKFLEYIKEKRRKQFMGMKECVVSD